ncbi:MAG: diguanylate cyclase [Gammaproteobacteria bacterium]|nr:diguanylate cyclase [Gammaproteobacteria bacterium]MDH3447502.1 diguanylate cyclase [Gammaproteobacteria bacterium]
MTEKHPKPSVLLVARSTNSLKLVGKHLQAFFEVSTATDAEAAWNSLLENSDISLLLGELELMIDKFGLLERIRSASDSWLAATPVLLLIGENDNDARRELAFQKGATDFINLPFSGSELGARARLHANLYLQHHEQLPEEMPNVTTTNVLQQLSPKNFFNSRAQQELSFSQRHRGNISLCKIRLNNVKALVDRFDKAAVIGAVKAIALIIQKTLRREDCLSYFGNAEFCLLYPATNGIGATTCMNRIIEEVSSAKLGSVGKEVSVTLSAAVYSCIANEDIDLEKIYAALDRGLVRARSLGGNQVVSSGQPAQQGVASIDRALKLIAAGSADQIADQAGPLLLAVLPLLEYADEALQLGLSVVNRDLRAKLKTIPRSKQ